MDQKNSELVTLEEARLMLGISRSTIHRMVHVRHELHPIPGNPAKLKQPLYFYRRDIERIQNGARRAAAQERKAS